jgi:hypothetical protein
VGDLLASGFPKSGRARIDVRETLDSGGDPSLKIRIVFTDKPAADEMRDQRIRVVDELRTWLAKNSDDRFPYISFTTEQDEKDKELAE